MALPKETDTFHSFMTHEDDVPEEEGFYPKPFDSEALSWTRDLGRAMKSASIGMRQERIPPGRRTSFTHAHSEEEELAYVLRGTCVVRIIEPGQAAREYELRPGHAVAFPAGTGIAHTFINHAETECILLCVGERKPATDQVFFPEDTGYDEHMASHRPQRHWNRT